MMYYYTLIITVVINVTFTSCNLVYCNAALRHYCSLYRLSFKVAENVNSNRLILYSNIVNALGDHLNV